MKTWIKISTAALVPLALAGCSSANKSTLASTGSPRLSWTSSAVNFDTTGGIGVKMSALGVVDPDSVSSSSVTVPLTITQVAALSAPTVNGSLVQANAVVFNGTKAYVAYNTQGAAVGGGIDVVDFSAPAAPVMTSTASYPSSDINNLFRIGTELYAVGADNSDFPAFLYDYALTGGGDLSAGPSRIQLPGYAGVGVKADLLNVYAVSGDNAGLSVYNRTTLTSPTYVSVPDARDIDLDVTGLNVVTGRTASTQAHVVRFSLLGLLNQTSADMTGATVADGAKATIQTGGLLSVATAGTGGTNLVCTVGGAISTNIPIPTLVQFPNLTPDLRASNSAAYGNGLIYVANGAAGISVYTLELGFVTPSCLVTSSYVGRITFPDGVSINKVSYSGGVLIAATGLGGFRVLNVSQGASVGLQLSL